jgi:ABC-type phosphate transport system substrate-binding protein
MTTRRELLKWSVAALAGAVGGLGQRPARAQERDSLAIVVAKDSPIQGLSQFELKKLYLGANITDSSGQRIVPFNQPPSSPDRILFEQRVLGMTPDEVARHWIDNKIRGGSAAPKAISPADLLQKVVSRMPHSLAYVRVANVQPDVRVLAIDGNTPGDGAYRLFT